MITLRPTLSLTDRQVQNLVRIAVMNGFKRVDPTKRWSHSEHREAARYAIEKIVGNATDEDT